MEIEAEANIIFYDKEDLDLQATALQSCLLNLEANTIKASAMNVGDLDCQTLAGVIIDSEASATFVISQNKISNGDSHKSKKYKPPMEECFTRHIGEIAPPIGSKALYLPH